MQIEEYANIFSLELWHWWYKSLHGLILNNLSRLTKNNPQGNLLDVGCGSGGALLRINKKYADLNLIGIDLSTHALSFCNKRGVSCLFQTSTESLPFADNSFDYIISLDVLYHSDVNNDKKALTEIYRVLKTNGYLLLHLPAFNFLKGQHDSVVHTKKRYTKPELLNSLESVDFRVKKCSYRNMLLFPVLYLKRCVRENLSKRSCESDLAKLPFWLNSLMGILGSFENRVIDYLDLPFGSS